MFAYIPARGGSKRIPRKNVKKLGGEPIISHVIRALKNLDFIDQVYVSTDDDEIIKISEKNGATCLEPRKKKLSDDYAGFIDLIKHDIPRFAKKSNSSEVLFVLATAALLPKYIYEKAYKDYIVKKPQVLMSCEPYDITPLWSMAKKADGYWYPLHPDEVLKNSHDLPTTLVDAGLFYYFNLPTVVNYKSLKLVDRLLPFIVPDKYRGDIDTMSDWSALENKFNEMNKNL